MVDRNASYLRGYLAKAEKKRSEHMSPFEIGRKVTVRNTGTVGTIDGMFRDVSGVQWRVQYLDTNGVIQSIYVHERDLDLA